MRGFLQRLASTAVHTAPRMHPFVESIYAAPAAPDIPAPLTQFQSAAHNHREQPISSPAAHLELSPNNKPVIEKAWTYQRQAGARIRETYPGQETFEPLLPPQNSEPTQARSIFNAHRREENAPTPSSAAELEDMQSNPAARSSEPGQPLALVIERLMGAGPADASQSESAPTLPEMQAAAMRQTNEARQRQNNGRRATQISQAARPYQAQSEEVQIHIGRIEVVAVQQPAQKAAAAPPPRRLSLDEYLSRRNGRLG